MTSLGTPILQTGHNRSAIHFSPPPSPGTSEGQELERRLRKLYRLYRSPDHSWRWSEMQEQEAIADLALEQAQPVYHEEPVPSSTRLPPPPMWMAVPPPPMDVDRLDFSDEDPDEMERMARRQQRSVTPPAYPVPIIAGLSPVHSTPYTSAADRQTPTPPAQPPTPPLPPPPPPAQMTPPPPPRAIQSTPPEPRQDPYLQAGQHQFPSRQPPLRDASPSRQGSSRQPSQRQSSPRQGSSRQPSQRQSSPRQGSSRRESPRQDYSPQVSPRRASPAPPLLVAPHLLPPPPPIPPGLNKPAQATSKVAPEVNQNLEDAESDWTTHEEVYRKHPLLSLFTAP